jgi:NAD-dependent dihydropyrimidine dehydrogenase PreA subunit/flavodoxin
MFWRQKIMKCNIKRVAAVYFSGTGTTEKVVTAAAKRMAEKLGAEYAAFDFTTPKAREDVLAFSDTDAVVFGTPVYAGRVPNVLLPYLTKKVRGGGAPAVPVVLYGNRNFDDALIELRDILEADGFRTIAAGAFVGEHSFSRILGAGRPDEKDMEQAERLADTACERLASGAPESPVAVKGCSPLRPYYTPRDRAGNPVNILKVKPKTSDKCTKCGLCVRLCPMGSIDAADPSNVTGICIKCGACVKKCPEGAKYYDDERYIYHMRELEAGYARRAEPELF